MTLRDLYEEAWREHWGLPRSWTVNLSPADDAIIVGEVGFLRGRDFEQDKRLGDIGIDFELDPDQIQAPPWQVQSSRAIEVEVVARVDGQVPNVPWLGNAEAGLSIGFKESEGAVAFGASLTRRHVRNLDNLRSQLVNAFDNGSLTVNHAIIVGTQITGDGSIFLSQDKDSSAMVTGKASLLASGFSPLKGEASVSLRRMSGSCRQNGLAAGSVLSFRALVLVEKGFLWWKHVELQGFTELGAAEYAHALASETPDDEYFLLFD